MTALSKIIYLILLSLWLVIIPTPLLLAHEVGSLPTDQWRTERNSIQAMLSSFKVIRVWVDATPGMGHQSGSLLVMKRLRHLGFNGEFEVVFARDHLHHQQKKMEILFPGFDATIHGKTPFIDKSQKVTVYGASKFKTRYNQKMVERHALTVCGGTDSYTPPFFLNTDNFLLLNPAGWSVESAFVTKERTNYLPELFELGPLVQVPEVTHWDRLLEQKLEPSDYNRRGKQLHQLFEHLAEFDSMPWYGADRIEFGDKGREILMRSLIEIQNRQPSRFPKGLTIPLVATLQENQLAQMKTLMESHPDLKGRVSFLELNDPNLANKLNNTGGHEIRLVNVGQTPQDVFNQFFHLATLPPLISGKGTKHLMELLGLPYISAISLKMEMKNQEALAAELRHPELKKLHYISEAINSNLPETIQIKETVRFIEESLDKDSSLRIFFQSRSRQMQSLKNDLVFQALLKVTSHFNPPPEKRTPRMSIFGRKCVEMSKRWKSKN